MQTLCVLLIAAFLLAGPRLAAGQAAGCPAVPLSGCRHGKPKLLIRHSPVDAFTDKFVWRWAKGEATELAEFGDPTQPGGAIYRFCVYDYKVSQPTLFLETALLPASPCVTRPCWQALGTTGFRYQDSVGQVTLTAGGDGKAKVLVKGRGINLGLETAHLSMDPKVVVQLSNSTGVCWEALYTRAVKNAQQVFSARGE